MNVDPYRPPAPSPRGWVVRQYDPLVVAPVASAAATLPQPDVWAGHHAYTTAPAAAATATAIAPTLLVDIGLSVPIVTATADITAPELYVGPDIMFVTAPAATAAADAATPVVELPVTVNAPAATATADAATPAVSGNYYIQIAAPAATAAADAPAAVVSVSAPVTAPAATAAADAANPAVQTIKVVAPSAVSATATVPTLYNAHLGAPYDINPSPLPTGYAYGLALKSWFNKQVDADSDTWKVALHTSSLTPDADTHQYWDAEPYTSTQSSGSGYTAGGVSIGAVSVNYATKKLILTSYTSPYWSSLSLSFRYAVLYDASPASDKPLLAWWDFGATKTLSSGALQLSFNFTDGLFSVTVT